MSAPSVAREARRWPSRLAVVAAIELAAGLLMVGLELRLASLGALGGALLRGANVTILLGFVVQGALALRRERHPRLHPWLVAAAVAVVATLPWSLRLAAAVALAHELLRAGARLWHGRSGERLLTTVGQHPARSLVLSFAALIIAGSFLLQLPAASASAPVPLVDAFFTAVSAVCVTGLTTVDTAVAWSTFGKAVILGLVQLGGIGVMSLTAFMTLAVGGELGLRRDALLRGAYEEPDAEEMRALIRGIVLWTIAIETAGALLLLARFALLMPLSRALAFAFFHSISAFCNAGFALYSDNLVRFAADPAISLTIGALILLGGLGFGVLVGLGRLVASRGRARLSVHARLVLVTSGLLVWAGAVLYFGLEYDGSLAELGFGGKLLAALFQSISARTAGFNTVLLEGLAPATVLVMIVLMFIGASPGSTGGGIKTTTFAILALTLRALVTEREEVEIFGRRIPQAQLLRALGLASGAALTLVAGLGALLLCETQAFGPLAFEVASALGTVGLSMGVTPKLTLAGRLVVAGLMFVGRVGPLTVLAAAARREARPRLRLPEGRVLVG